MADLEMRAVVSTILGAWVVLAGAACGRPPLAVAPEVLSAAPRELLDRVRSNPYDYFRLTNHEWTSRVCDVFADELPAQPIVQLHGDAHVEQFAMTSEAWGLDDFDDSARGPALVDLVRFLGSIELAAGRRGWSASRDRLFDRFLAGYRRGLSDTAYRPPAPDIVRRLRAETPRTRMAFLEWAESMMVPLAQTSMDGVIVAMQVFGDLVRAERPGVGDSYFRVVRAGWLRMGIGSAAVRKVLIRIEGPSSDPSDDVLLEAKALRRRGRVSCLERPASRPTFRIVVGSRQIGRLRHDILVAGPEIDLPEMNIQGQHLRDWWIRSWDASYREIGLSDLGSVQDLSDIAYDSGVQLAAGALHDANVPDDGPLRTQLLASLDGVERRIRNGAVTLVGELMHAWRDLGGR